MVTVQMEARLQKPQWYIPLATLCCLLWASAFPAIKLGYRFFAIAAEDTAAQILFAGCRFALAGVLSLAIQAVMEKKLPLPRRKQTFLHIGILAAVQTALTYTFFYLSLARIEGSAGSVLNAAGSFFCVLLAAAVFREDKLTLPKVAGCVAGLAGIVLLNLKTLQLGFHFGGEGLMLVSAACYALSSVLIKKFSQSDNPALLCGWQFLVGGLLMVVIGLVSGGRLVHFEWKAVAVLLYLAMVSAVAYTLWSVLLKYNDVSRISVFGFINPVGGVILSALLLGEQINVPLSALCLLLVSGGIVLVNYKSKKRV